VLFRSGEIRLARVRRLLPRRGESVLSRLGGRLAGGLLSSRHLGAFAIARSVGPSPTVWLHEFHVADMQAARVAAVEQLRGCSGGKLGLRGVREIVLSTKDLSAERKRWQRLLDPATRGVDGAWHLGDGPSLRLVEGESDRIEALVCEVASLDVAAEFLEREGMLAGHDAKEIRIAPAALQGLDIRLTEALPEPADRVLPSRREASPATSM
jgi:hypothetical protein